MLLSQTEPFPLRMRPWTERPDAARIATETQAVEDADPCVRRHGVRHSVDSAPMSCPTGKRCYDTRAEARSTRKRYPGASRRAYRCPHCDRWHLGRLPRAIKHGDPR